MHLVATKSFLCLLMNRQNNVAFSQKLVNYINANENILKNIIADNEM